MAEMDQGIKRLIQTRPVDVLALALPDVEYLGTQPIDVATEPQLVLDTLLRVRYHLIRGAETPAFRHEEEAPLLLSVSTGL